MVLYLDEKIFSFQYVATISFLIFRKTKLYPNKVCTCFSTSDTLTSYAGSNTTLQYPLTPA